DPKRSSCNNVLLDNGQYDVRFALLEEGFDEGGPASVLEKDISFTIKTEMKKEMVKRRPESKASLCDNDGTCGEGEDKSCPDCLKSVMDYGQVGLLLLIVLILLVLVMIIRK
ncbi:hypothetical protein ACFLRF_04920, partial [Candidatus Altiarchaeota archaeon]